VIWKLALVVTAGLIFWLAGTWAFAFWRMIQVGYIKFVEPNRVMLYAEFYVAVLITVAAVVLIIIICRKEEQK